MAKQKTKYRIAAGVEGTEVSLLVKGLPRVVRLNENTPVAVLKYLYESGTGLIEIESDGSDNEK